MIHYYMIDGMTKIIILFYNLYQRLHMVWTIFEKIAIQHDEFDILKQFNHIRDLLVQTCIIGTQNEEVPDIDMMYSDILGNSIGSIVCNIPVLCNRVHIYYTL